MGTYNLPRNVKGEGRILFVFTGKSFIYAIVGGGIGLLFYGIFSLVGLNIVGIAITVLLALVGFAIGTLLDAWRVFINKWWKDVKKLRKCIFIRWYYKKSNNV